MLLVLRDEVEADDGDEQEDDTELVELDDPDETLDVLLDDVLLLALLGVLCDEDADEADDDVLDEDSSSSCRPNT